VTRRKIVFLLVALSTAPTGLAGATEAEIFADGAAARPDYVKQLEDAFGVPSQKGFGSTVLFASASSRGDLNRLARSAYRHFVGNLWDKWGEAVWMGQWRLVYERTTQRDIVGELRVLDDPLTKSSADMLLEGTEDSSRGQDALSTAFNNASVRELLIFAIGDGGAMSGLLVAARRTSDEATFLVFLMD
jgi:hypothetical protein